MGEKREKRLMEIVATTSLPAVERRPLERRTLAPIITRPVLNLNFLQKITRIPDKNDVS